MLKMFCWRLTNLLTARQPGSRQVHKGLYIARQEACIFDLHAHIGGLMRILAHFTRIQDFSHIPAQFQAASQVHAPPDGLQLPSESAL